MEILCSKFLSGQLTKFITLEDLFHLHAALEYSSFQGTIFKNLKNERYWNWDLPIGRRPDFNRIGWIIQNNLSISGISFVGIKIEPIINLSLPYIFSRGNGVHQLLKLTLSNCKFENYNKYDLTDFNEHLEKILRYNKNLIYIDLNSTELNDKGLASISSYCKNVKVLHMWKCSNITNVGIRCVLNHLKRLLDLDISFCKKITNGSFEHDEVNMDFLKLKYIDIENVNISSAIGTIAKKCPDLVSFDCSGTSSG